MKALKNENNLIDLLTLWKSSKHCTLSLSFAGKMHLTLEGAHMRIITFYPVWYSCISFSKLNVCPRRPDPNSNVWGYWWNALDAALWKLWKSMITAWNHGENQNDDHDFCVYRNCKAFVSVFYGKYIQSIEILMKPTMGFDYSCLNKPPDWWNKRTIEEDFMKYVCCLHFFQ